MKIEYRGIDKEKDRDFREAYISYNGNTEQKTADRVFDALIEKGWKVEQEEECADIRVYDKTEYNELLKDYIKKQNANSSRLKMKGDDDMKWYVYFIDERGMKRCHCFEDDEQQARHFASLVNGNIIYC